MASSPIGVSIPFQSYPEACHDPGVRAVLQGVDMEPLLALARRAGEAILAVYGTDFEVSLKADHSPLTEADRASHQILSQGLTALHPTIALVSEEGDETEAIAAQALHHPQGCWLVDPLDGTKEFLKKNGEFTVNIAWVVRGWPLVGVVYAPSLGVMYWSKAGEGAFRQVGDGPVESLPSNELPESPRVVAGSRSHGSDEPMGSFLKKLEAVYGQVEMCPRGSALKLCLVAEGTSHVYPRFGPTMLWDSAAGHSVLLESGKGVYRLVAEKIPQMAESPSALEDTYGDPLLYLGPSLRNPHFICY